MLTGFTGLTKYVLTSRGVLFLTSKGVLLKEKHPVNSAILSTERLADLSV